MYLLLTTQWSHKPPIALTNHPVVSQTTQYSHKSPSTLTNHPVLSQTTQYSHIPPSTLQPYYIYLLYNFHHVSIEVHDDISSEQPSFHILTQSQYVKIYT